MGSLPVEGIIRVVGGRGYEDDLVRFMVAQANSSESPLPHQIIARRLDLVQARGGGHLVGSLAK